MIWMIPTTFSRLRSCTSPGMTMPAASDNGELYRDHQSSVSPAWLINGRSRYALRTVVKLEFCKIIQPRARAGFMLSVGIVLSMVSVRYMLIDAQPDLIPVIMLAGSMTLMAGGACVLYLARPRFRIDVTLLDGSCVSLPRKTQAEAEGLLAGLSKAMDWHRSTIPEGQGPSRTSRVRHGVARLPLRQAAEPAGLPTVEPVARRPGVGPVVAVEQPASVKAQIAALLSLLCAKRLRRPAD